MDVYPMDAPGLANPPPNSRYTYSPIEGIAAVLFLTRKAFEILHSAEHREAARAYLIQFFLAELDRHISLEEMKTVVPLLTQRYLEYSTILSGQGEFGDRYLKLGEAMIGHIIKEPVDSVRVNLATLFLLDRLLVGPSKNIAAMEEAGAIEW